MPREASPAFQFYPQDFLSDLNVVAMDPTARGVYITLLCHCWIHGSIPKDERELRRISAFQLRGWASTWVQVRRCFVEEEGELKNPRIERERRKQAEFRAIRSKSGQAGGKQRASNLQAKAKQTSSKDSSNGQANSSSSSSSSSLSSSSYSKNKLISERKAVPAALNSPSEKSEKAKNVRIITKIAHEVLQSNGHSADGEAVEAIKTLCAQRHIAYDSETVRKALDSAEAQSA